MVVRTPTLNSLKRGFLPSIHQPLPLGRRESQQLLDSITSSFRKNLDKEHPAQSEDAATLSAKEHKSLHRSTGSRPTNSHQRAILNHLLLSHPQQHGLESSPSAPTETRFDVFDAAVAKGLMTTRRAAGFLATIRRQVSKQGSPDICQDLAATGAGFRVLQWLRASGQEDDLRFLSDIVLIEHLIPFMYAEGLEEVVWTWLAQLATSRLRPMALEGSHGKVTSHPLRELMGALMKEYGRSTDRSKKNLDQPYSALLRADQLLPKDYRVAASSMIAAWRGLAWESTVFAWNWSKPSVPLFESFVELGTPFGTPLNLAHLELHHPTTPSADSALYFMYGIAAKGKDAIDTEAAKVFGKRLVFLALDTVDRLKQAGDTTQASWVETFLTRVCEIWNVNFLNMDLAEAVASDRRFHHIS